MTDQKDKPKLPDGIVSIWYDGENCWSGTGKYINSTGDDTAKSDDGHWGPPIINLPDAK